MCGSNLETIWVLRRCMGLAPLDKLHRTGELARYKTYISEHEAAVRSRQRAPRTVFDMPRSCLTGPCLMMPSFSIVFPVSSRPPSTKRLAILRTQCGRRGTRRATRTPPPLAG